VAKTGLECSPSHDQRRARRATVEVACVTLSSLAEPVVAQGDSKSLKVTIWTSRRLGSFFQQTNEKTLSQRFQFARCVDSKQLWSTMAAKRGTRRRYIEGCHCDDCTAANTAYQQRWRQRRADGEPATPSAVSVSSPVTPEPVEVAVETEIADLAEARPGVAQIAPVLARVLDNPRAV
jgi:hypothetical protein